MNLACLFLLFLTLIALPLSYQAVNVDNSIATEKENSNEMYNGEHNEQAVAIENYLHGIYSYLHPTEDLAEIKNFSSLSPDRFVVGTGINSKGPFHKIVAGVSNRFILGLKNYWVEPLYVIGVTGYITAPDYSRALRNISRQKQWSVVNPSETLSTVIEFIPDFEATSVGLLLLIEFTDKAGTKLYHSAAFQELIEISAPTDSAYDMQSLLLYLIFSLFVGFGAFLLRKKFPQKIFAQKKK